MLKVWNMVLIILTYAWRCSATFITRTGVISSSTPSPRARSVRCSFRGLLPRTFLGSVLLLWRAWDTLPQRQRNGVHVLPRKRLPAAERAVPWDRFVYLWGTIFPMIQRTAGSRQDHCRRALFRAGQPAPRFWPWSGDGDRAPHGLAQASPGSASGEPSACQRHWLFAGGDLVLAASGNRRPCWGFGSLSLQL